MKMSYRHSLWLKLVLVAYIERFSFSDIFYEVKSQSSVIWQYIRVKIDSVQLQMLYKDNGKVDKDMKLSTNERIARKM